MTEPTPHAFDEPLDRVCAVVVTFFPDAGFPERLEKIATQVSRVVVVDNGTSGRSSLNLDMALGIREGITCIRNRENIGVAAALNQGVRAALKGGERFSWITTFDQDSLPAPDMVERMKKAWKCHPDPERLMVAGPRTVFVGSTLRPSPAADPSWTDANYVITSGSLFSSRAFEVAGYFHEGLFIDYVDVEYCLRLRTLGYQVIEVHSAEILHQMGRLEENVLVGTTVHPTHHPPLRRYYQFRNALLLHRQYRTSQRPWRRRNRLILIKMLILIVLYEKRRLQSLMQAMRGIGHGLAGRSGRNGEGRYTQVTADTP